MVRLRRFNFIKMSGAISTFDVYPPSAAPEATRVRCWAFNVRCLPAFGGARGDQGSSLFFFF